MGVDGYLGSGAIQDHLVGFQLVTILTDQSHISKVWVIVLYQVEMGEIVAKFLFLFSIWFVYLSGQPLIELTGWWKQGWSLWQCKPRWGAGAGDTGGELIWYNFDLIRKELIWRKPPVQCLKCLQPTYGSFSPGRENEQNVAFFWNFWH